MANAYDVFEALPADGAAGALAGADLADVVFAVTGFAAPSVPLDTKLFGAVLFAAAPGFAFVLSAM